MFVTTIKMVPGSTTIAMIFVTTAEGEGGYVPKDILHDYLRDNPDSVRVNIPPYPALVPVTSRQGVKFVRTKRNSNTNDNLLRLPRE